MGLCEHLSQELGRSEGLNEMLWHWYIEESNNMAKITDMVDSYVTFENKRRQFSGLNAAKDSSGTAG